MLLGNCSILFSFGVQLVLDPETAEPGWGGLGLEAMHWNTERKTKPLCSTDGDGHRCFQVIGKKKNDTGGKLLFSNQSWPWRQAVTRKDVDGKINNFHSFPFHCRRAYAYYWLSAGLCLLFGILMQSRRNILSLIKNSLYFTMYTKSDYMNKLLSFCVWFFFFFSFPTGTHHHRLTNKLLPRLSET